MVVAGGSLAGCNPASVIREAYDIPAVRPIPRSVPSPVVKRAEFGPEPWLSGQFIGLGGDVPAWAGAQGVTVAVGPGLVEQEVRLNAGPSGAPATDVLQVLVGQSTAFASVIRRGESLYYVGEPRPDDLDYVVIRATGSPDDTAERVRTLLSAGGTATSIGEFVIARDVRPVVDRLREVVEPTLYTRGQYLVEVRLVELAESERRQLGLEVEPDVRALIDLAAGSARIDPATFAALLVARETGTVGRLVQTARIHVRAGSTAQIQLGETTPIPKRAVQESGVVTTLSYEYVDTGFLLDVGVTEEPDGFVRLELTPEQSSITGFVEGAPIRSRRRLKTSAVVRPGGVVVLGGYHAEEQSSEASGLPFLRSLRDDQSRDNRMYVVLTLESVEVAPSPQTPAPASDHAEGANHGQ